MNKYLIIPKIAHSGGTRQYFINLTDYLSDTQKDCTFLISKTYFDEEIKSLVSRPNFNYHLINEYPDIENIFSKLNLKSLFRIILNFKKIAYILFLQLKFSIDKTIFSEWNLIWDFLFLFTLNDKYFVVHSYPLKKLPAFFGEISFFIFRTRHAKITTVSEFSARRIGDYWFNKRKGHFLNHIYNFSKMEKLGNVNSIKSDHNDNRDINVLTIGHLVTYKNPELWLKIAYELTSRNKRVKFMWIGEGHLYEKYKLLENDGIKFLGNIQNLKPFYKSSYLYFQPSKIESQGLAVIEAMSLGIPSIVSTEGGLAESVKNGYNGYTFNLNENISDICKKFEILFDNKILYETFKANCSNYYLDNFSKDKWYNSMEKLISD